MRDLEKSLTGAIKIRRLGLLGGVLARDTAQVRVARMISRKLLNGRPRFLRIPSR